MNRGDRGGPTRRWPSSRGTRRTGWRRLADAVVAIRAGALWVATNVDAILPSEHDPLPGNGSMVQVVRTASGAEPQVAGKPAALLLLVLPPA